LSFDLEMTIRTRPQLSDFNRSGAVCGTTRFIVQQNRNQAFEQNKTKEFMIKGTTAFPEWWRGTSLVRDNRA
jgi:hypothetical protein